MAGKDAHDIKLHDEMTSVRKEMNEGFFKVHEKADSLSLSLASIGEHLKAINGSVRDNEEDIKSLNMKVWAASGAVSAISIIAIIKSVGFW